MNVFKRLFRSLFRKQGSVNKGLIAAFRSQIAWNDNANSRLDAVDRLCEDINGSIAQLSERLTNQPRIPGPDGKASKAVLPELPDDPARLSNSARNIHRMLEEKRPS